DGEARFAALENWARARIPQLGRITHRWSGQVMEPADYTAFIGRTAEDSHRYLVTGDSGQGMTHGVIASLLISNLIIDDGSPWEKVYEPGRTIKNVSDFLTENLTILKSFAKYLAPGEITSVDELAPGAGGLL